MTHLIFIITTYSGARASAPVSASEHSNFPNRPSMGSAVSRVQLQAPAGNGSPTTVSVSTVTVHVCMEQATRRTLESCFSMCPTRVRVRVHVCSLTIKQSLCHCLLLSGHNPPLNRQAPHLDVMLITDLRKLFPGSLIDPHSLPLSLCLCRGAGESL